MQRSTIAVTSSGSSVSERLVKPDRSAKRAVAQRRSETAEAGFASAATSRGDPQLPQNRKAGGLPWPHAGQVLASGAPHMPQKRWSATFMCPQRWHFAGSATCAVSRGGCLPYSRDWVDSHASAGVSLTVRAAPALSLAGRPGGSAVRVV